VPLIATTWLLWSSGAGSCSCLGTPPGFGKAVVWGASDAGPVAMMFAATRPERTQALILSSTFAYAGYNGWDDLERDPAELQHRMLPELGARFMPSAEQIARFQKIHRAVRSEWGSGAACSMAWPSLSGRVRELAMYERMSPSPGMARASLEASFRLDMRPILSTITAPTMVIHAREDPFPVQFGRHLADHIAGARYLEVEGVDHAAPWSSEPDRFSSEMEEFLTGSHAAPSRSRRALRTVLFTDMVASTQRAAATGDQRWRPVLQRFGEITAALARRFGGTVVNGTGDGHLVTFDGPTRLFAAPRRCASMSRHSESRSAPVSTPASANCSATTSAASQSTSRPGSAARPALARSLSLAPSAIWSSARAPASRTAAASSCGGVPGTWQLLAVDRDGPPAGSAEAELASMPTPGRRTVMRRSDRAVEMIARRTPWILRGMARLALATGRK
jgi:pimeloyl-ACP methyl ester carboxylesterase